MSRLWHDNVTVDPDVTIGPYCVLGSDHGPLHIPAGSVIRSHTIIEGDVTFDGPVETGHHVLIRHGTRVGTGVRVGSYSSLEGGIDVGDYTRLLGRFQAGSQFADPGVRVRVGAFVTCYSGVMMADNRFPPLTDDRPAEICDGAVLGMGAFVMPGVMVGKCAFVAAQAVVNRDVPPGRLLRRDGAIRLLDMAVIEGHTGPWTRHPHARARYPREAQERLERLDLEVAFDLGADRAEASAMLGLAGRQAV